ncbi:MAG: hypothetical protein ACRER2_11870 [Methylococcales bacterium]
MNNLIKQTRKLLWIAGLGLIAGMPGATAVSAENKQTQEHLLKRAGEYWEARRINDLHTLYGLETAAAEKRMTPDQVQKAPFGRIQLVGYKFRELKIEGGNATMVVDLEITIPELEGKSVSGPSAVDRWTFIKGDWYHGPAPHP